MITIGGNNRTSIRKNTILHGYCEAIMPSIDEESVDLILCDLPYGTTTCKWDSIIPFDVLWENYNRIIKPNGAIVLFCAQPFTSMLVNSNPTMFKYEWIWEKNKPSGVAQAKNKPVSIHENIAVFSKGVVIHKGQSEKRMNYYPQNLKRIDKVCTNHKHEHIKAGGIGQRPSHKDTYIQEFTNYPNTVLKYDCEVGLHPTQKPVALLEYLIKTYTSEGELVLDNSAGSFSTIIAAINTNRNYIGIEKNKEYFDIGYNRIQETLVKISYKSETSELHNGLLQW